MTPAVLGTPESIGKPKPEHKPTEANLNVLINAYRGAYMRLGNEAVDAVVASLEVSGHAGHKAEAEAEFIRGMAPLLTEMTPYVEDAIRLGIARLRDPRRKPDATAETVRRVSDLVRRMRHRWLDKLARDFSNTVYLPVLAPPRAARKGNLQRGSSAPRGARTLFTAADDLDLPFASPEEFGLGDPEKEFVFDEDTLDELTGRGYRFVKVRAVEATEHDIWKADDLGYIDAVQETGVQVLIWRISPDDLVCPVCGGLGGLNGDEFTLDEARAASEDRGRISHCRCRCWFAARSS